MFKQYDHTSEKAVSLILFSYDLEKLYYIGNGLTETQYLRSAER